jgi:predicted CxxxxCH...CXXCH cytochrome family protein
MHHLSPRLLFACSLAFAALAAACDFSSSSPSGGGADGGSGGGDDAAPGDIPDPSDDFDPACRTCHGDETSPAPPKNLAGETDTTARGVGAHRAHLSPNPLWHRVVDCADCHAVPAEIGSPGHLDDGDNRAELSFGAMASTDGASPAFDGERCANAYCHGATLSGGTLTEPVFTAADGGGAAVCGSCHGFPPPPPHVDSTDCGSCHATIRPGGATPDTAVFLDPASHINGRLEVSAANSCDSCHGGGGAASPPRDLEGNTEPTAQRVGAHVAHLAGSDWRREIVCTNCHVVPAEVGSAGHIDGDNQAEVPFDAMNPVGTYAAATATCQNLYCHGNGRASNGAMVWNQPTTLDCNSCHGTTGRALGDGHGEHLGEGVPCAECHQAVVDRNRNIIGAPLHINGARDVRIARGGTYDPAQRRCTNLACHGSERW